MAKIIRIYWPQILITAVVFAFFARLFLPPSFFINPDYGRSDLMHSKIPTQLIMSKSLKSLSLPLWEPSIGQGFPVLDEGEMGFFYLPNLILFSAFPFWLAFNLSYPITFLIAAFGAYFLARSFNLGKTASCAGALTFAFCPVFTLHIHHYNLIQAASIIPWLFWEVNSFANTKKVFYLLLLPLTIAMQYFAGFPQFVAYTLPFLLLFLIFQTFPKAKSKLPRIKLLTVFVVMVIFGTLIASVQIEASYKLVKLSSKLASDPQQILIQFPYLPKNLLTLVNPYILGNPKFATYPRWEPGIWGIFWESNSYFGLLQLILVSAFLLSKFFRKKFRIQYPVIVWCFIGGTGILLALGNHAPLHPIFSIPPYSIFRVPARFLVFSFLSASMLTAFAIQAFPKPKNPVKTVILGILALAFILYDSFLWWYPYQLTAPKDRLLTPPSITEKISQKGRVVTIGEDVTWDEIFFDKGWATNDERDKYLFFRNFLGQNLNLLYNQSQLYQYESIVPRRIQNLESLSKLEIRNTNGNLQIGPATQKVLNVSNVVYATSNFPIVSKAWQQMDRVVSGSQSVYLYQNLNALPHVFLVNNYKTANNLQDLFEILRSPDFDENKTVILEQDIHFIPNTKTDENTTQITNYQNTEVSLVAKLKSPSILVLSDTYDPDWHAKIDDREVPIYPANINSRAVIVPEGTHQIDFYYRRDDIKFFGLVSLVSLILTALFLIKFKKTEINLLG